MKNYSVTLRSGSFDIIVNDIESDRYCDAIKEAIKRVRKEGFTGRLKYLSHQKYIINKEVVT